MTICKVGLSLQQFSQNS